MFVRALESCEKVLGSEHPNTLVLVNNLAGHYESQGRYGEAEPMFVRVLKACEKVLGPEHPTTRIVRDNLAACRRGKPR